MLYERWYIKNSVLKIFNKDIKYNSGWLLICNRVRIN